MVWYVIHHFSYITEVKVAFMTVDRTTCLHVLID